MFKVYQITKDVDPEMVKKYLSSEISFEYRPCTTEEDIIKYCQDGDGIISVYEPMTEKVMKSLKNLKYICLGSIGYNAVDVKAAKELGIDVSTNPTYCVNEVADHALALSLNLLRGIDKFQKEVKVKKNWDYTAFGNSFHRISTLTIGLLGFGNIAKGVAKRFQAFGAKVLAYDPYISEEIFRELMVEKVELSKIQEESDLISIHLPLTKETKNFVDQDFLEDCVKSPYLINVSRGEIVDQEIIKDALEKGLIRGIGLDVLDDENPDLESLDFLEEENVLLTPHVAFYSQESIVEADSNCGKYVSLYEKDKKEEIPLL
ncbi:MAG: C-terminal binding protein [Tissierellia bacterium]|nr:C-terminal binding protein [Tissierellia bacterium]